MYFLISMELLGNILTVCDLALSYLFVSICKEMGKSIGEKQVL